MADWSDACRRADASSLLVFPELPGHSNGKFARPPQHTSKAAAPQIPADQVPKHVAVVMDGNGRWATQRGLGRTEGHKMGEAVLIDITCGAIEIGIKHLTVYAFSTENWKRSTEEVRFIVAVDISGSNLGLYQHGEAALACGEVILGDVRKVRGREEVRILLMGDW